MQIGCRGCVSQDTWPSDPTKTIAVHDLLAWCKRVAAEGLDGITISGASPSSSRRACALLEGLHVWRRTAKLDFDLLCYSGYPLKTLERKHAKLLALLDAVIPEPYVDPAARQRLARLVESAAGAAVRAWARALRASHRGVD